jgi:hypothetical protein
VNFDWSNVVVGHWRVCGPTDWPAMRRRVRATTGTHVVYYDVWSRCGFGGQIADYALADGPPARCHFCYSALGKALTSSFRKAKGMPVLPLQRRMSPRDLEANLTFWEPENMIASEHACCHGDHAKAWEEDGLAAVRELVARTGLGLDFGWKAKVYDTHRCHPRAEVVRVRDVQHAIRTVDLLVTPPGRGIDFEVKLATGRNKDFEDVAAKIRSAADALNAAHAKTPEGRVVVVEALPPEPAPQPEPTPSGAVAELLKFRSGLDEVIAFARDSDAANARLAAARQEVEAARQKAIGLIRTREAVADQTRIAKIGYEHARDKVVDLNVRLNNACVDEARQLTEYERLQKCLAEAERVARGPEQDLRAAEELLAEAEAAEKKRTTQVSPEMMTILDALKTLQGGK